MWQHLIRPAPTGGDFGLVPFLFIGHAQIIIGRTRQARVAIHKLYKQHLQAAVIGALNSLNPEVVRKSLA